MSNLAQLDLFAPAVEAIVYGPFITRKEAMRRGLKFYYVGTCCKRGHFAVHRIAGGCFECHRISYNYKGVQSLHGRCPIKMEAKRQRHLSRLRAIRQTEAGRRRRNRNERERYANLSQEKKIAPILRSRIYAALRIGSGNKAAKTMELIGCSVEQLKEHIEAQWQAGMSWGNWSLTGWHIDHIRPCASFDLSDPAQQRICFHYTNLQPLWAADNIRKGAKLL